MSEFVDSNVIKTSINELKSILDARVLSFYFLVMSELIDLPDFI